jgi:type II secretion system protein G
MNRILEKLRKHKMQINGFTLIELLIVVIILGILAAIVTIGVAGARNKSVEKSCKQSALNLVTALDTFYLDNGAYPASYTAAGWLTTPGTRSATTPASYLKSPPVMVTSQTGTATDRDYYLSISPDTGAASTEPTVTGYANPDGTGAITGCVYPNQ